MKIIVGIVVYEGAVQFLEECLKSLENQTSSNFMVMLVNDNIAISDLGEILEKLNKNFCNKLIIVNKYGENLSPYLLRIELIKEACQRHADLLVFLDCDDKASDNRIECICQQYEPGYAFFYNELLDFQKRSVMPLLPDYTRNYRDIGEYNYLGMSNGTINLRMLSWDFIESLKDGKTAIFDWYLYSRILLERGSGKKIQRCYTYYRIYDGNIAGKVQVNKEEIERELAIKIQHYKLLSDKDEYFSDLLLKYSQIKVEDINLGIRKGYWWSLISYDSNCTCERRFKKNAGQEY